MTFHSKYVNDCGSTGERQAFCAHSMFTETSGAPCSALRSLIRQEKPPITKRDKCQRRQGAVPSPAMFSPSRAHVLTTRALRPLSANRSGQRGGTCGPPHRPAPRCAFRRHCRSLTRIGTQHLASTAGGNLHRHRPSSLMSSLLSCYEYDVVLREGGN